MEGQDDALTDLKAQLDRLIDKKIQMCEDNAAKSTRLRSNAEWYAGQIRGLQALKKDYGYLFENDEPVEPDTTVPEPDRKLIAEILSGRDGGSKRRGRYNKLDAA